MRSYLMRAPGLVTDHTHIAQRTQFLNETGMACSGSENDHICRRGMGDAAAWYGVETQKPYLNNIQLEDVLALQPSSSGCLGTGAHCLFPAAASMPCVCVWVCETERECRE